MGPSTRMSDGFMCLRDHKTWYQQGGQDSVALVLLPGGPEHRATTFHPWPN
jgi:hypothetical protein